MSPPSADDAQADWAARNVLKCAGTSYHLPTPKGPTTTADKTLACRAFWGVESKVARICAPRGTGKSMMMAVLRSFFCLVKPRDMPGFSHSGSNQPEFDPAAARANRLGEFEDTLLRRMHPEFFDAHFGRHPVISMRIYVYPRSSVREMYQNIAIAMIGELVDSYTSVNRNGLAAEQLALLGEAAEHVRMMRTVMHRSDTSMDDMKEMPAKTFAFLSKIMKHVYKRRFILLVDGYDEPVLAVADKSWPEDIRTHYLGILDQMLRDEMLEKALLVGVYPLSLGYGSGTGLENMATVSISTIDLDRSLMPGAQQPSEFLAALGSMYDYTERDVMNIVEGDRRLLKASLAPIADLADVLVKTFGGYSF
ncbi:hypothetical protein IWQ57_001279, partial [Coemansia nantahalensis]